MWFQCNADGCKSAWRMSDAHRNNIGSTIYCPFCGAMPAEVINDTDEQWYIVMMKEFNIPDRKLLDTLMKMFQEQKRFLRFDAWYADFMAEV